jgi:hypothetical protein
MKDENGNDREYLVFWNGKDRIQTETTFWLEKVFGDKYQDDV